MLKTAVVGLGMGLDFHIPSIVNHPGFDLIAVADVSPDKLKAVSEKYGAAGYLNVYEMMDTVKPDLVVVASPTQYHAEHTIGALERGIDVFLEKPMARDLDEAKSIFDVQARTGKKLMVYQPHRIFPETMAIKRMMEKGVLGNIYMIKRAMSCFFIRANWQAYRENGGGTLNNHGAHYIDLLLYLSGGKAGHVSCELQRIVTAGDADDCAKVMIKTDKGVLLDIDMNMASALKLTSWYVFGTRGTAVYTVNETGMPVIRTRYHHPGVTLEKQKYIKTGGLNDPAEYPWVIEDFEIKNDEKIDYYDKCYEYYALDKEPFVPVTDTLAVMDVLQRCHQAAGKY